MLVKVMHITLFCLYSFSVLQLFCFHPVSGWWRLVTTTYGSTIALPSSRKHPDGRPDIQEALLLPFNSPYTNRFRAFVCMDGKELW